MLHDRQDSPRRLIQALQEFPVPTGKKSTLVSYLENRGFSKDISRVGGTNRFTSSSTCTSGAATGSASITAAMPTCGPTWEKKWNQWNAMANVCMQRISLKTKTERDWETILTSKTE
eukprot:jgi/Pico_ML_1/50576/g1761.t1